MTPWAERWEASIGSELLLEGDDLEVEFDFANLMRGDAASRSAYYQSGIQNGWLTRNEARVAENLNPLEGLDEPLRPLNMVEEGDAEEAEPPDAAADSELEPQAPVDEETNARFRAVLVSAADRWARRISRSGAIDNKEIGLIAEALAVPVSVAEKWAQEQDGRTLSEPDLRQSLIQLGMNS
jgi:hypothetical protein